MRFLLSLLISVLLAFPAMAQKAAPARIAMVIGMADYQNVIKLRNTLNDAKGVGQKLEEIGFEVTYVMDATQQQLLDKLQTFAFEAETANIALIYYAGHGVEASGQNFLIPVDANVRSLSDVARVSVSLDQVLASADRARSMRIVILDACRNNPFGGVLKEEDLAKAADPGGLAPVNPNQGTLVAYAQKEKRPAEDGAGNHSPYAQALIDAIGVPKLEIGMMFRQVRDAVLQATSNRQEPWTSGSLPGLPFYLAGSPTGSDDPSLSDDPRVAWSQVSGDSVTQMRSLADQGDVHQMIGMAYVSLNPDSPNFDAAKGVDYMTRAAEAGNAEAQYRLGQFYEAGIGVEQNSAKALEYYMKAADQGHPKALNDLGFVYAQGMPGVEPDQAKAVEYFTQAAELRLPEAMFNMSAMIDAGLVPGKGPKEAAAYLYDSIRAGSKKVLDQLAQSGENYSLKTRVELQKILKEHGFLEGKADGTFGPASIKAARLAFGMAG